ncbi:hypothetical protein SH139x_001543 [Planctomycetaceae bacterium SH139]
MMHQAVDRCCCRHRILEDLVRPLIAQGTIEVTRLRSNEKLFEVLSRESGQSGRPRKYAKHRISLKERAGRRDGRKAIMYAWRGVMKEGRY